jgi:hypothetical protein
MVLSENRGYKMKSFILKSTLLVLIFGSISALAATPTINKVRDLSTDLLFETQTLIWRLERERYHRHHNRIDDYVRPSSYERLHRHLTDLQREVQSFNHGVWRVAWPHEEGRSFLNIGRIIQSITDDIDYYRWQQHVFWRDSKFETVYSELYPFYVYEKPKGIWKDFSVTLVHMEKQVDRIEKMADKLKWQNRKRYESLEGLTDRLETTVDQLDRELKRYGVGDKEYISFLYQSVNTQFKQLTLLSETLKAPEDFKAQLNQVGQMVDQLQVFMENAKN